MLAGYYGPSVRADVPLVAPPAIPVLGDVLRYTVSPLLGAALLPLNIKAMFAPLEVPERFSREFPHGFPVRPSQIRASAAESALMIPAASRLHNEYSQLQMPVAIVAGAQDRLIESEQAWRLNDDIRQSSLQRVPGSGHMVHQTATAEIMSVIEMVTDQSDRLMLVPTAA